MNITPARIQLSRRNGWRMPENTVKVDRATKWGNPHIARDRGPNGETPREYAVLNYRRLLAGWIMAANKPSMQEQSEYRTRVLAEIKTLRGKNLACWCPLNEPCHADVLLEIANK